MICKVCTRCGRCDGAGGTTIADSGACAVKIPLVARAGLGAAVDIGSTTIVMRVVDLATGEIVRRACTFNPQRAVAADVMGRISAALAGRLDELRDSVRASLRECAGDCELREAVVTGNTTMLHLLAGVSPASFATAPFKAERLFGERMAIDGVDVRLPRCAHAFFGADAVGAVWASGMCDRQGPELLADIGTNGEIALWKDGELTIASVAAGPAFERPGITGSQIIAALADGLDAGAITETGYVEGTLTGGLTLEDVRAVQLAKAAVHAGLEMLLAKTNTKVEEIRRLTLAGGFGSALDCAKAARIGLFPRELLPVTTVAGNLAIESAQAALFDPAVGDVMDAIAARSHHIELGGDADFSDAFMDAIVFDCDRI